MIPSLQSPWKANRKEHHIFSFSLRSLKYGGNDFTYISMIPSFQHGELEFRLTRMSSETFLRICMPGLRIEAVQRPLPNGTRNPEREAI
jgi:hypothetical protein